jgi:endonuclease/exonuclease/phosphatase family metal-dependent hydrolase
MQRFHQKSGWWARCATSALIAGAALLITRGELRVSAASSEIVLYASDVTNVQGNWGKWSGGDAAGGQYMASVDAGWSTLDGALQYPGDYFEASFNADGSTPYHVWLRMRAGSNSKWNDSVWVQFSDAVDQNGSPIYQIGSTSALLVNLEPCNSCGVGDWGWQDGAYWLSQLTSVRFASSGGHTVRVQTREDGVQIDQIVLSPSNYLYNAPGRNSGDSTVLSETAGSVSSAISQAVSFSGSSSGPLSPYHGSPAMIPTKIEAEDFDNGGEGVAYHDSSRGNNGAQYRQTDVDIEPSSNGGYDVGWVTAGEWLNYTVNVPAAGSYVVWLRVAAPSGASFHIGFNAGSNVWKTVGVPGTGGWQSWTIVQTTVSLAAGTQQLTLYFDTGGMNVDDFTVGSASGGSAPSQPAAAPSGGGGGGGGGGGTFLPVIEWNIQVNDASESHARQAMDVLMSASPQPQVVVLVEAWQFLFNTYIDELQRQTGRTWYGAFGTHCAAGTWNGGGCAGWSQGVGIFSTYPIVGTNTTYFPYADCWTAARVGLRAGIDVNGTQVNVFAMHLQTGGCNNDIQSRNNSMRDFKSWASNFSQPQIVAGDFNADPDQIDAGSGMAPNFVDSWWSVGSGSWFTAFAPNPSMKLDYWLSDSGGRAQPTQSAVLNSQGVSDHNPLQASFVIR